MEVDFIFLSRPFLPISPLSWPPTGGVDFPHLPDSWDHDASKFSISSRRQGGNQGQASARRNNESRDSSETIWLALSAETPTLILVATQNILSRMDVVFGRMQEKRFWSILWQVFGWQLAILKRQGQGLPVSPPPLHEL